MHVSNGCIWCTERAKSLQPVHRYLKLADQSNEVFNLTDLPNQTLYLACDLIGLFKKRSAVGKLCDDQYILNGLPLIYRVLLFYVLHKSGALVNLHDDCIRIAVHCYI